MSNKNNISIGNAGEYFVAGELERHGFTVAVPMSNVRDFDILAIDRKTYKQFAIQVKTTTKQRWVLNEKNENIIGDNIFYVFVHLNGLDAPDYHIIPSSYVAKTVREEHRAWLESLGRKGQKHNDTTIRNFEDKDNQFLDKWDLLK